MAMKKRKSQSTRPASQFSQGSPDFKFARILLREKKTIGSETTRMSVLFRM
jgi:hypothetical protein